MLKVKNYLTDKAREEVRHLIAEAGGNEVFLVGKLNADRIVVRVQIFARGNDCSAPALLQVAQPGDVVIHNHPSGTLVPSSADMNVASILGNDGIGFYIVDNPVADIYAAVEPFEEKQVVPVNPEALIEILDENGPVARKLENYEFRPQQIDMVTAISEAINGDKISLIEAGTGTGKTLAYLLPAITHAVNNKQRIVISTNTINLQEQLVNKDLPFLQTVLPEAFSAALVKGRSNYVCKRKVRDALADFDLFTDEGEKEEFTALLEWAETTKDGSKTDLNVEPRPGVWEKIQSESDTSLKTRCPFYNSCFFYQARRNAAKADILVANHHLLFADLALRTARGDSENAVLPTYERIILDEAHNIEEVATNYFGTRVTYLGLLRILGRLYRQRRGNEKGLLLYLSRKIEKQGARVPHEKFLLVQGQIQQAIASVQSLSLQLTETMETLYTVVGSMFQNESGYNEMKLRLTPDLVESEQWQAQVLVPVKNLVAETRRFTSGMLKILRQVEKLPLKLDDLMLSLTIDLRAQLDRLDAAATSIEHVLLDEPEGYVCWLEVKQGYQKSKIVRLMSSPLNIAPVLQQAVFNKFKNVNLTSATLTVEGSFDYIKSRLGLDSLPRTQLVEAALSSPFDYEKQVCVAIPSDLPEPNHPAFFEAICKTILAAVDISQGRAFVLFTAYGLLNKVFNKLQPDLNRMGHAVYKQGQENRHRLLNRFKKDTSSILFATDSFWEGVDVQGEALELVIISKLPFRVPSEPVIQARIEELERQGRNAFTEYTVPQAAIKFKQGFGRLIRRKTDRGAVLILDKRVVQKSYGRTFLRSLPDCRFAVGPQAEVLPELERFFRRASG